MPSSKLPRILPHWSPLRRKARDRIPLTGPLFTGGPRKGALHFFSLREHAARSRTEIVAGAWDFKRINRRYARHLKILGERPGGALRNDASAKALLRSLEERHGVVLAGGQGRLEGQIIRIGHMGWVGQDELAAALRALQFELNSSRAPSPARVA